MHEVTETLEKALKGFLTINTVLMSLVVVWFSLLCLPDELDMDETVTESFLIELMAGGEPRKCYAHRVGSVQLGLDVGRSVFFVWPRGLTRSMTSNLLGRLGSCVLSVLSGKGPHAAHWKLPLGVKRTSILPVLNIVMVIGWHGLGLPQ